MIRSAALAVLSIAPLLAPAALAAELPPGVAELAAHRAHYRLALESVHGGDVQAGSGTMDYEVIDACDSWATHQKLEMMVTNRDGQDIQMTSDYTTFETKDGLAMRFRMKQITEQAVTSETEGEAKLEKFGGPGEAHYRTPNDAVKKLPPGTLFPMVHTAALIEAARAGKKFLAVPLFDGTSENGVEQSFVVVERWTEPESSKFPALSPLPSTRVHISFFEQDKDTPDYQVAMRYWTNGVADDLHMDFGDFAMHGTMTEFHPLPHRC